MSNLLHDRARTVASPISAMQQTMVSRRTRRDPRSPPDMTQVNASTPETCEFYGLKNRITRCRYPRSCRDCLAMDGCALDGYSGCVNASGISSSNYEWDYQVALRSPLYNTSYPYVSRYYNFFRANTTDYCAATDPVCLNCTATFERLPSERGLGSQFCVGENGCVCVGMCEVQDRYSRGYAYDEDCLVEDLDVQAEEPVVTQLQPFTSRRRDPRAPLINIDGRVKEETCSHYSVMDIQGNAPPRTCQDCLLNKECVINFYHCVGMSEYRNYTDFRSYSTVVNNASYSLYGMFPAVNTTYCPSSDAKCSECRDQWKDYRYDLDGWSSLKYGQFCVGETGCVCIQPCESKLWEANAPREYKPYDAVQAGNGSVRGHMIILVTAIVLICVCILSPRSKKPQRQPRRDPRRRRATVVLRHMLEETPSIPGQLNLSGWMGLRQNLVHKEHRFLRGEDEDQGASSPTGSAAAYTELEADSELSLDTAESLHDPAHPPRRSSSSHSNRDQVS